MSSFLAGIGSQENQSASVHSPDSSSCRRIARHSSPQKPQRTQNSSSRRSSGIPSARRFPLWYTAYVPSSSLRNFHTFRPMRQPLLLENPLAGEILQSRAPGFTLLAQAL